MLGSRKNNPAGSLHGFAGIQRQIWNESPSKPFFVHENFFFSLIMRSDKDPCTQNVSLYAAVQILIKRSVFILLRFLLSEPLTVQYWAFNLVLFYLELIYWASPVFFCLNIKFIYLPIFAFLGHVLLSHCIYFTKQSKSSLLIDFNPNPNGRFNSKLKVGIFSWTPSDFRLGKLEQLMAAVNINMIKTVELVISTASVVCLLLTEKAPQRVLTRLCPWMCCSDVFKELKKKKHYALLLVMHEWLCLAKELGK